ncbi:CDG_1a_G0018720.mRNA.1.CDS.1 [Saccharomyces cerevisiae]|nr:CDG_1a_G0018720.mRNA.1.CDS.1 [Saccharomyces cerevisiae]CAI7289108.1 CDG_1a_G0018720.mRNA.1.CDS.1 [Saccharomyces cerevisiae]
MSDVVSKDRKALFDSAVSFLKDESIKDAPLLKKIEFLKSKGLTEKEIEIAMKEPKKDGIVGDEVSKKIGSTENRASQDMYLYEAMPPMLPHRDWKDYFVMATATAGLLYGAYEVTRRYVIPNILPEAKSKLEGDKKEIDDQFSKIDTVLNAIEAEQAEFRKKESETLKELSDTIAELKQALVQTTRSREKIEDEFRIVKLEVVNMQNTIDKFVSDNDGMQELNNIQKEMESLKSLMNNRMESGNAQDNRLFSISPNGIPGIDTIPSASEILAKMGMQEESDKEKENGSDANKDDNAVPAWKKAREQTIDSNASIPEWQKNTAANEISVPDWQNGQVEDSIP